MPLACQLGKDVSRVATARDGHKGRPGDGKPLMYGPTEKPYRAGCDLVVIKRKSLAVSTVIYWGDRLLVVRHLIKNQTAPNVGQIPRARIASERAARFLP